MEVDLEEVDEEILQARLDDTRKRVMLLEQATEKKAKFQKAQKEKGETERLAQAAAQLARATTSPLLDEGEGDNNQG